MATSFLTNLSEEEFKDFLKQALNEILSGQNNQQKENLPDILTISQAAAYLKLKVNTLYEKTSRKLIPHFKKGRKLFFIREELLKWVQSGEVKTRSEMQMQAVNYDSHKNNRR